MFFSISKHNKDNFVETHNLGKLFLHLDGGWKLLEDSEKLIFYKGYADFYPLIDLIDQDIIEHTGNFCFITFSKQHKIISIRNDKYRSFPIFVHENEITNLLQSDKKIFADTVIDIDQNLVITHLKFNPIGKIETSELPFDEVRDRINEHLLKKTSSFIAHNNVPIKTFLSGGVDSLLVFTLLNKTTKNYELVLGEHLEFDKFWMCNSGDLQKFWGYSQIHHWREHTILTSGCPGDEFMMRSPYIDDMYLSFNNLSFAELINSVKWGNSFHSEHFKKANLTKASQSRYITNTIKNKTILNWNLCNVNLNDWQHWHLGNTLTWTPLRDIEVFKLTLRLPLEDMLDQIFNSKLSLSICEENLTNSSKLVSDKKNYGNTLKNLYEWLN